MFKIYIYKDPITYTPRYVGYGQGNRPYDHLKNSHNAVLRGWIKKLKSQSQLPIIDILIQDIDKEFAVLCSPERKRLIGLANATIAAIKRGNASAWTKN